MKLPGKTADRKQSALEEPAKPVENHLVELLIIFTKIQSIKLIFFTAWGIVLMEHSFFISGSNNDLLRFYLWCHESKNLDVKLGTGNRERESGNECKRGSA